MKGGSIYHMSGVTKHVPIRPLLCAQNARLFYLYFTIKILNKFSSENFKINPLRYPYFVFNGEACLVK